MQQPASPESPVKASVIIPAFNAAKYLPDAITSVFKQTFRNIELIIVDDGSTDHTREIVSSFIEKNDFPVRYIFQNNEGVGHARNTGIAAAKGEYLAFLDADDMWMPNKLERQVNLLEGSMGMGLVFTSYLVPVGGKISHQVVGVDRRKLIGDLLSFEELVKWNFIGTSTVMVRKKVMQQVGPFDNSLEPCDDYDMWLRISEITNIAYIDEPLMIYRIHPEQISTQNKKLNVENEIRIYETWLQHLSNKNQEVIRILRQRLHTKYFELGRFYLHNRHCHQARHYYKIALRHKILGPKSFKLIYCYFLSFM